MLSGRADEACRLNGSKNESTFGSLCGWLTILPPTKRGKNLTRWWFEFKERLAVYNSIILMAVIAVLFVLQVSKFCPFDSVKI